MTFYQAQKEKTSQPPRAQAAGAGGRPGVLVWTLIVSLSFFWTFDATNGTPARQWQWRGCLLWGVLWFYSLGLLWGPATPEKARADTGCLLVFIFFMAFFFLFLFFFFDEWDGMGWDGFFLCSDGCVRYEVLCYLPYRMIDENRIARL